jgi:hypothetical protein
MLKPKKPLTSSKKNNLISILLKLIQWSLIVTFMKKNKVVENVVAVAVKNIFLLGNVLK